MKIDMGRKGPLGITLMVNNGVACVEVSGKGALLHSLLPGPRIRELSFGGEIAATLSDFDRHIHTIRGHGTAGTLAIIAAESMVAHYIGKLELETFGAKRPPWPFFGKYGRHYRIKGDWVPFLPPWRPELNCAALDYGKLGPIEAHDVRLYREQVGKDGAR